MIVVFKSPISLQLYLEEEQGSGIMDAISKYGAIWIGSKYFDGKKLTLNAMAASGKGGGLGGILRETGGK
jgi:hypothetical protein